MRWAWRTAQTFGIMSGQRKDHDEGFGRSFPRIYHVEILVWHERQETRIAAARQLPLLAGAVLVVRYRGMVMAPLWLIKSNIDDVRCFCLSHHMIVRVQECAFGSDSMRHKHRHCQKRDHARKLLPDRRHLCSDCWPYHGTGTPTGWTCSSAVPQAKRPITFRAPRVAAARGHRGPSRPPWRSSSGSRSATQSPGARCSIRRRRRI